MVSIRHRVQSLRAARGDNIVWYYDMTLVAVGAFFLAFLLVKQLQTDSNIRYVRTTVSLPPRSTASLPSETKPIRGNKIDIDVNDVRQQLKSSMNAQEDGQSAQSDSTVTMSIEDSVPGALDGRDPTADREAEFVDNANKLVKPLPPSNSLEGTTSPTEGKVMYMGKELSYYRW